MDALYAIQQDLHKQIMSSYLNFKKKGAAKMNIIGAQTRLSGVENLYSQFETNHRKILSLANVPLDHEYFKSEYSEQVSDAYYDRKGEFLQFIEDTKQIVRDRNPPQSPVQSGHNVTINAATIEAQALPKMSLPKFTGKFTEWENFRDLFRSVVHRRADLDPSIKYYHLRSNLSGDALDHIKAIPIAGDQYEKAWTTLTTYYDNKRRAVNTLISSILGVKPMRTESDAELKRINREFFSPLESLYKLGRSNAEIGNDLVVHVAVELFENNTKREWKKSIDKSNDSPPTIQNLKEFILGQIENLDEGRDAPNQTSKAKGAKTKQSSHNPDSVTVQTISKNSPASSKSSNCILCNAEHYLAKCDQFAKKSIAERREFAKPNHVCFNCLGVGHSQNRCKSKYNCFTCKRRHHTLLHVENSDSIASPVGQTQMAQNSQNSNFTICATVKNNDTSVSSINTAKTDQNTGVLLATALVCVSGPKNKQLIVKALIDPGSQISLVTENLCNLLSLKQESASMRIQGVGNQSALRADKLAHLRLKPHFSSGYCLQTTALVLPIISSYKPPVVRSLESLNYLAGLQLADPSYLEQTQLELLLGADVYASIIEENIVRGSSQQSVALQTKFGWLLTGKVVGIDSHTSLETHSVFVQHCTSLDNEDVQLSELVQEFWRVEELPAIKNSCSAEEEFCEDLFIKTTTRNQAGRYMVRLPWRESKALDKIDLGSSYPRALNALKRLESSFQRDKRLETEYTKFIKEYMELGHMTAIDETPSVNSDYFFLPHHGVWKENSSTTKLRTVFNGSSRLKTGESLNDFLYSGSNLLTNPIDLICSARNYEIALSADVEKMFRMVEVNPQDRKFQAIIWRFTPLEKIVIYLLNTLTYGLTCSSYLAIRTLLQMAADHEQENPVAANVVRKEMYSDNVLTGAHTIQEAVTKVNDLVSLFAKAQMNLRKWSSNNALALSTLPEDMLAEDKVTLFHTDSSIPLLGIAWHTSGDYFCFHCDTQDMPNPATKRNVLSRIARLYDPLGLIAPVIVLAKILLQSLWLQKLGWDDPLPEAIAQQWSCWVDDLPTVSEIKIPRWTGFTPQTAVEIYGFADASKKAYGAVLYLRFVQEVKVFTSLQVAKSRVAPVKTLSIPRLELCASLLLTRLAKQFLSSTTLEICDVHLWTDSADVLFWLRDHPSRWNVFVANRCSEIHTAIPNAFWHHVPSKENPADLVSRGVEPSKLGSTELWWKGPTFLVEKPEMWSRAEDNLNFAVASVVSSCKATVDATEDEVDVWPLMEKYSSLSKLLRVTAYCLRFLSKVSISVRTNRKNKDNSLKLPFLQKDIICKSSAVQICEIDNAQSFLCYLVQREHFNSEYLLLTANKSLSGKSPIACLNPIVKNHLIMVGGRLNHSLCDSRAKHPIILPHKSHLTTLFIRQAHQRSLHGGTQLTLATLRQQVWVINGRTKVREVIRNCVQCTRYAKQVPSQIMADLPSARVQPASPFQKAGVDYAGPISVRLTKARGRGTLKGYICIFVCMATKAVHLELAEDYSSESFIAAFHRFTARRGHCKELFSDQGTNFVGANAELKAMLRTLVETQPRISHLLTEEGTAWHFNPPSAPHFGGLWEAGVKSLKYHLRRVVGEQILTFSELSTLLCRIEACLNSRPLIGLTDDPSDLDFITPAHFLIQRASYLVPEPDLCAENVPIGKRWRMLSQMTQRFWARWKNEYLSALQSRNKWLKPKNSPKIGDLVFVRCENAPPGKWPLAKIVTLYPSDDGMVRVVTVKTATGFLCRPIVKLVFLFKENL